MSRPILSVCLITYNQEKYIRQAVDSILSQKTNFEWQLVIADDCSTDGTREILEEYKQKHPKLITMILQKKNKGPEDNWFDLITYPKSKYMLYCEGDDYFIDNNKLQVQLDFLESHPDYAICFHPVRVFYENHELKDYIAPSKEMRGKADLDQLVKGNFFFTNSVMHKRQDYTKLPHHVIPLDWYMHLYNAKFGKIGYIDKVMSAYRRHPGSIWWDSAKDVDKIWSKHGLDHMAMFVEMQKLFEGNKKYLPIINDHIDSGFKRLTFADSKYGSNQLSTVVEKYPSVTADYISRQILKANGKKSIGEVNKELKNTEQELSDSKDQLEQLATQLKAIQSSKLWKLRDSIAKVIPGI